MVVGGGSVSGQDGKSRWRVLQVKVERPSGGTVTTMMGKRYMGKKGRGTGTCRYIHDTNLHCAGATVGGVLCG